MKTEISIGIDPGWVNLGLSIVQKVQPFKVKVIASGVFNPSKNDYGFIEELPIIINSMISDTSQFEIKFITIERYVPYNNVFSSETENITMLIGMIRARFLGYNACTDSSVYPKMIRAIDWKIKISQICNQHTGFSNPSPSFDKKFSVALAKHITDNSYEFKTDHEADACCLASLPFIFNDAANAKESAKARIRK